MELWQLWLLATLDEWNDLLKGVAIISGMGLLFLTAAKMIFSDERAGEDHPVRVRCKRLIPFFFLLFVITAIGVIALPSSKQAWVMTGVYVATNTEGIDKLPENTVKALNQFLEQYTEDN